MDEKVRRTVEMLRQVIDSLPEDARAALLADYLPTSEPQDMSASVAALAAMRLNAPLRDGSLDGFLAALRKEVNLRGGVDRLVKETGMARSVVYAATRESQGMHLTNPKTETVWNILDWLGLELAVRSATGSG